MCVVTLKTENTKRVCTAFHIPIQALLLHFIRSEELENVLVQKYVIEYLDELRNEESIKSRTLSITKLTIANISV